MAVRFARNGQFDAADRRVIAGVLRRDAAVRKRRDKAVVVEEERDAAALQHEFRTLHEKIVRRL